MMAVVMLASAPVGVHARIGATAEADLNVRRLPPGCYFSPDDGGSVTMGNDDGSFVCGGSANQECEKGTFMNCSKVLCEESANTVGETCDQVRVQGLEDGTTVVECSGTYSCLNLETTSLNEVKCTGTRSCLASTNNDVLGHVECSGDGSCGSKSHFSVWDDHQGVSMTCSGNKSCEESYIGISDYAECSGENACLGATINTPASVILPVVREPEFPMKIEVSACVEMAGSSTGCTYLSGPRNPTVDCFTIAQSSCPKI